MIFFRKGTKREGKLLWGKAHRLKLDLHIIWAGYSNAERAPLAGRVDQINTREVELEHYLRPIALTAGFVNTG